MLKPRSLLLGCLLLSLAFAGCAEDTGGGGDGGAGGTGDGTGGTGSTGGDADPTPNIDSLLVGTEAAYPPFEDIVDGEIVGYDIDVMREVANRSGFTVDFQNSDFTAIIPSIQSGQFGAGISAFTITDDRKKEVDFSIPYYENSLMAAVRVDNEDIATPEDLQGKRVCTQEGTTSQTYLEEQLNFTTENLVLLDSAPLCADSLTRGDVDALMIDAAFVRSLIEGRSQDLKQAFIIPNEEVDEQFGIAVQKGNDELLNAINEALTSMIDDGTLQQLQDQWQV